MHTGYEIVDFHTHPFVSDNTNIYFYIAHCNMSVENTKSSMPELGISKICGSVIGGNFPVSDSNNEWEK